MCAERTYPIDNGKETGKDDLKILVFDGTRIKAKVLPYNRPDGLSDKLGWHIEAALGDIDLADALQSIARRGDCFSRVLIDIR